MIGEKAKAYKKVAKELFLLCIAIFISYVTLVGKKRLDLVPLVDKNIEVSIL